ncbi:alkaline phosphatase D family protein [Fulvivirgaceae bacterium PWU20]|uniref:Alkaline phosphatase D family protein n=1 Tax=Chryseosolibacter indicus TaxID=2782351 RepID=A0ABS5VZX9_9BACT|nr:alkaline phosphatase D family protein [Chryseosolibacter indicus]
MDFFEGVASFDPSQDKVILWTRYTPAANETAKPTIILDVSKESDFKQVLVSESVEIDTANDNTIHVDISNLQSNTKYFYRFRNDRSGSTSITGETKTLPKSNEVSQIKLAVVSCSNFQAGLFNVYGAVAESDADVVIHLGDYIYEYAAGGYGSNGNTGQLNRVHKPEGEIVSIDDYRTRYRQYRGDEQLQKAHQHKPFICVWDDHEIANDAYKNGAENHQSNEGDFATRKANALQVWHEYLPARVLEHARIYRAFDFGGILNLMMLDTRIIGRDQQLDYNNYVSEVGLNVPAFLADWQNPNRTILGVEQRNWLLSTLSSSNASWQVLGSQVLMGKILIPAEMLLLTAQIAAGAVTPELFAQYNKTVSELVTIKTKMAMGQPVSNEEKARVETVLPYNLDAWDGYPAEREAILASVLEKNLVSLAGDTHNAWYSKLSTASKQVVGAEIATPSVSSPGFEAIFGADPTAIQGFEQANAVLVDDLEYLNASERGFVLATFTKAEVQAEWKYVSTLATKNTAVTTKKTITITR